jgi:hypothetical protein
MEAQVSGEADVGKAFIRSDFGVDTSPGVGVEERDAGEERDFDGKSAAGMTFICPVSGEDDEVESDMAQLCRQTVEM